MATEEEFLGKAKDLIESKLGWGESPQWTNHDFLTLSQRFQDELQASVSHVTLKRIWGKVQYNSMPSTYTLNTLVQFVGYSSWREFKIKNDPFLSSESDLQPQPAAITAPPKSRRSLRPVLIVGILVLVVISLVWLMPRKSSQLNPNDYSFSSKKVLTVGVPNSVIFDYDASRAPTDCVYIQQSWDTRLRQKVSKERHQYTSIYYFPDFYKARLIVNGQVVKEHKLLIKSEGWVAGVENSPVPVYFKKEDFMVGGRMALSIDKIKAQNINLSPHAPLMVYSNVRDFGPIYSDHFVFEARIKNDYKDGSSTCQKTNVYLLCEGSAIGIPLCAPGCISDLFVNFNDFNTTGKKEDLSALGVDFSDFIELRIESDKGVGKVFLNNKLAYVVKQGIAPYKIIGIDFVFQGTGSVDNLKLTNGKDTYEDQF